jgi:nucleotide-binding universal stress UspA family protein
MRRATLSGAAGGTFRLSEEIRTVLVGTSLDEYSEAVARLGAEAARAAGARLLLVHASSSLSAGGSWWAPPLDAAGLLRPAEDDAIRAALAEQAARVGAAEWILEAGPPHRVLSEVSERCDARLIVVGAVTGGPVARLLGSTADRVVRKARRPVLVARGDLRLPPRRVLAPVDLSPLSGQAFRRGLGLLRSLGGGAPFPAVEALFVLSVVQRQTSPQFTPEQIDRMAAEKLERFVASQAEGVEVRRRVRTGNVREEILAELAETGADLMMIGTHGLGGFDRFAIGSVTADVTREAPCSVLVLPPSEISPQS